MGQQISDYQWKNRLVVLLTDSQDSQLYQLQLKDLKTDLQGLKERKILVITLTPNYQITGIDNEIEQKAVLNFKKLKKETNGFEVILVGLDGYENHLPSEISGGMRKRAGLARAMALNPKILFFDEPSAGLDPIISAGLDNLIIQLNKSLGTTMVIVTHELQSIFTVAHRVVMLDKGVKGIIAEGDPKYLKDHSQNLFVKRFFNRQADDRIVASP